jgi:transforming growth factor-beta-induced protein
MKNLSKLPFLFALAITLVFASSCSDDDEAPAPGSQSIVEIAVGDPQFSTLVAALTKADLVSTLSGAGPFTVFAPTNTAFAALLSDLGASSLDDISADALKPILLNHVVVGNVKSTDLTTGYFPSANASGPGDTNVDLYINISSGVKINKDVTVTKADVLASNGVIHIVDKVILPTDVVDIAINNLNFTSLVGALSSAEGDLVTVLKGDGPFTIFAPLNSAFENIAGVVSGLSDEQLADVLKYHVVAGANVLACDLTNGMEVTTLN